MKIRNNGKVFGIKYDAKDFVVPTGDMEIADEGFATFIINKARIWGIDVKKIGLSDKAEIKPIEQIIQVEDNTDRIKKPVEVTEDPIEDKEIKKTKKK